MNEQYILAALHQSGPMTGAQLLTATRGDVLPLWRICRRCPALRQAMFGRRYLRLDRVVEGYARLSPSIRREFLTYTALGLEEHGDALDLRAAEWKRDRAAISQEKINLAREIAVAALAETGGGDDPEGNVCFLIAGDVTYNMAHRVPRPEKSTGEMVRGSDLDIIAITSNDLPPERAQALDNAIYKKKHFMLVHPDYREEVDYLVKDLRRVREQAAFDTFESMVACKIMDEGQLLYGSRALFQTVKNILRERRIPERLARMETLAAAERVEAEASLLALEESARTDQYNRLFFTQEEGEEIY